MHGKENHETVPTPSLMELENIVTSFMNGDDLNIDGYIDFCEFSIAQKKRNEQASRMQQQQSTPPHQ